MPNLLDELPDASAGEIVEILAAAPNTRIERITTRGQASEPGFWYDQEEDEWVTVLTGWGELEWADGRLERLAVGDHVHIRAHERHRVAATSPLEPTVWLAVFWSSRPSER